MAHTGAAARRAVGAACAAVDAVLGGAAASAFVCVRPPGHHAEPDKAMGFCFLSNVGVAAHHARATHGLARLAIVDWDVHHGNGTQRGFETDAGTLFLSSHQSPCYPNTGATREVGLGTSGGAGRNVFNSELKPGSGSAEFRKVCGYF